MYCSYLHKFENGIIVCGGGGVIRFELPIFKNRVVKWLMDIGRNQTEELVNSKLINLSALYDIKIKLTKLTLSTL